MRSYECTIIVHPEVEDVTAIADRVKELVERDGGKVVQTESWGTRRLAYPIRNQWEGQYVLMRLEMEAKNVAVLESNIELTEQIMRHLIVRVDEKAQPAKEAEPAAE